MKISPRSIVSRMISLSVCCEVHVGTIFFCVCCMCVSDTHRIVDWRLPLLREERTILWTNIRRYIYDFLFFLSAFYKKPENPISFHIIWQNNPWHRVYLILHYAIHPHLYIRFPPIWFGLLSVCISAGCCCFFFLLFLFFLFLFFRSPLFTFDHILQRAHTQHERVSRESYLNSSRNADRKCEWTETETENEKKRKSNTNAMARQGKPTRRGHMKYFRNMMNIE